jgi:hypothetical protein
MECRLRDVHRGCGSFLLQELKVFESDRLQLVYCQANPFQLGHRYASGFEVVDGWFAADPSAFLWSGHSNE